MEEDEEVDDIATIRQVSLEIITSSFTLVFLLTVCSASVSVSSWSRLMRLIIW
jgi:hypothetical protein